jgi:hypothetical protein
MRMQNRCTKVVLLTLGPAGSFGLQGHSCRWTVADELFTESPDSHFGHSRVAVVVRQSPGYRVIWSNGTISHPIPRVRAILR